MVLFMGYIPTHLIMAATSAESAKAVISVHGHWLERHEGMRWFKVIHEAGFNILAWI
jgi:hypothetical protein